MLKHFKGNSQVTPTLTNTQNEAFSVIATANTYFEEKPRCRLLEKTLFTMGSRILKNIFGSSGL